jgi:plasmid stabilization system protein ParE
VSRYIFGGYVEGDLREIRDYIARDSPYSARRMMIRFVNAFRLLAKQPELGHVRQDLLEPAIRFWPVGAYLILYRPAKTPIEILAVVHGARDVPSIANRRAER